MRKSLILCGLFILAVSTAAAQENKINITIMSCKELVCQNQKDVFLVNESAYIDYNSSVKEITYAATITFPDGTTYQTQFPNRIISNVTGNYTIDITVWKEGYEETKATKIVQFVDSPSKPANPPTVDWSRFLLLALATVLTVFVVWRVYMHRKRPKPVPENKKHKTKSGK